MEKQRFTDFIKRRRLMKQLIRMEKQLKSMVGFHEAFFSSTVRTYNEIRKQVADQMLRSMSVDELQKAKQGIRIAPLRNAGIRTIQQLRWKSPSDLERIHGIGPGTANKIYQVTRNIVNSVNRSAKVRLDPNSLNRNNLALARDIYVLKNGKEISDLARNTFEKNRNEITRLRHDSRPARNWLIWSLSKEESKEIAISSITLIEEMLNGKYRDDALIIFEKQQNILKAQHDKIWRDFREDPASYYAIMDDVVSGRGLNVVSRRGLDVAGGSGVKEHKGSYPKKAENQAVENGLPIELAVAVSNVSLDLKGLKKTLRPYQVFGVKFIMKQGVVLLGDDMGLGKTAQAIASMVCLYNNGKRHFFVICPASVIINWCREIYSWCSIKCYKIHGTKDVTSVFDKWVKNGGIGVTTYETLAKLSLPDSFKFSMLVVDEAHYAKNPYASRTNRVLYFRQRTSRVLYMTGTPLENRVDEMRFLIKCLNPSVAASIRGLDSYYRSEEFRRRVAPVYFRRKKEDVLSELPDKIETAEWVDMTPSEKLLYRQYVNERNFAKMRQASWMIGNPKSSSKGARLLEIVDEAIQKGDNVLVFSFFLDTIDQVNRILNEKYKTYGPINGSVTPSNRQKIIDDFSKHIGGAVLLSQIQAGGTGLNIQRANVVIICEPQFKPSIENQAIGRVYRMGQIKAVNVHRLLCENSVDERIVEILKYKQRLFDEYADESESAKEKEFSSSMISAIIDEEKKRLSS